MKPIQRLTLCALFALGSLYASAYDFSAKNDDGKTIYYNVVSTSNLTCCVTYRNTNYNSYSGSITIPQTVDYDSKTYTVVEIGIYAFYNCSGMTDVIIPNSVTSIGGDAFRECSGLTSITIPDSVTTIGQWAFYDCTGLTGELKIPDSVTSIGKYAFYNCSGLTGELKIPDSVTTIADCAFYDCSGLTGKLVVHNNITSIGDQAFKGCTGLAELTLEDGEKTLSLSTNSYGTPFENCLFEIMYLGRELSYNSSYSPFQNNDKLANLTIGNFVNTIYEEEFYNCSGLKQLTLIDSDETLLFTTSSSRTPFTNCPIETLYLGRDISYSSSNYSPFRGNTYLTFLTIGNKVTTISNYEFYNCSGLTSELKIPNSLTTIGNHAFQNCQNLTGELKIPDSVTYIGIYAFSGCSGLEGELKIPNSVTTIGRYAFSSCMGLTSVNIPNSVTTIGDYAFAYCSGLTGELKIPDSVTTIGDYAFRYCSGLTSITIGNGVTEIGDYVFADCSGWNGEFKIPENVTTIGDDAFYNCSSLSSLIIGNGVTEIGMFAFADCSGLKSLTIEDSDETLLFLVALDSFGSTFTRCPIESLYLGRNVSFESSHSPFRDNTYLISLTIGDKVTTISNYEFYGCSNLRELTFKDGEETLSFTTSSSATPFSSCPIDTLYLGRNISYSTSDYSPFRGKTNLTSLTIGNKVTNISSYEFYNCTKLAELVIPNNVTTIGSYAFYWCTGLTEITIPNCVTTIEDYTFYRCSGLTEITIPNSVTTIGQSAFNGCSSLTSVNIPNSVNEISKDAFNISNLGKLTLEDGDKTLTLSTSSSATPFSNGIETLYLGRDIIFTNTSYSSFMDSTNLTSLTIGGSVTCIPSGTFSSCTKLIDITILGTTPPTIYSDTFSDVESVNAPKDALLTYANTDIWNSFFVLYAMENGKTYYPVPIIYEGNTIVTADGGSVDGVVAKKGDRVRITPLSGNKVEGVVVYHAEDITEDINKNGSSSFEVTEFHLTNRVYTYGFDAEHYFDITLASAGQLLEELTVYNVPMVYGLKVTGEVNGTDIMAIRKMPYIQQLDLSDATIVSGGDPYYDYYETTDNVIGKYFFIDMPNLKYVKLPKDITSIENYAFSGLTGLTGISIPGSVTLINSWVFESCSCLAFLVFEDGSETLKLDSSSFSDCPLVSLYLGRNLDYSSSRESPFYEKNMLTSLTISHSVTKISNNLFYGCAGLTEVTIPEEITSIEYYAFANCTRLTTINFNATNCRSSSTLLYTYPIFSRCSNLTDVNIGDAVVTIPNYLFETCSSISEIIIPNSVTTIGSCAFRDCSGLTSILIPDNVETIGSEAFRNCTKLETLTIGESVESIGSRAFYNCSKLSIINSKNPTPPDITSDTFDGVDKGTCVLNVPFGSLNDYWIHLYWGLFFHINEVDFGYEELKEEIETTQDLLEDVWDTITTEYPDLVDDLRGEYENLKEELEKLLQELKDAYNSGTLDDEKMEEIRQKLEDIKRRIDELLAAAVPEGIRNIPNNSADNDVQIYNLSGARVNTPTKGNVYIFRFSDGTTKKVFIK